MMRHMVTEADVVRAALDLEADFLEDLGRAAEADAVRRRQPIEAGGVSEQTAESTVSAISEAEDSTLSVAKRAVSRDREPVAAEVASVGDRGLNYGEVARPSVRSVQSELYELIGDDFVVRKTERPHPQLDIADRLPGWDPILGPVWDSTVRYFREDASRVVSRRERVGEDWRARLMLEQLQTFTRHSALPRRIEVYSSLVDVVLAEGLAEEYWVTRRNPRMLHLLLQVGDSLDIPHETLAYLVVSATRRWS